jgi:hypothetical protein
MPQKCSLNWPSCSCSWKASSVVAELLPQPRLFLQLVVIDGALLGAWFSCHRQYTAGIFRNVAGGAGPLAGRGVSLEDGLLMYWQSSFLYMELFLYVAELQVFL